MPNPPKNTVTLGKDISFLPSPLRRPTPSSPRILVIGGGVSGLISSWVLLDRGYHVTVVSKEWASYTKNQRITSQIAGALWEYPPASCGMHTDVISLEKSKGWSMVSYPIFKMMADDPELSARAGVRMIKSDFFFSYSLDDHPEQHAKMVEIMNAGVHGFRRDPALIQERNVSTEYDAVDAYEFLAPVVDTDTAMAYLMELIERKGAKFVTEQIHGDLLDQEAELCSRFGADIIVNATGLAGSELASDGTCYPLRGGVLRLINDGSDFPKVETAMVMTAQAVQDPNDIIFIVPRNENILLLGSITQPHEWDLDLSLESDIVKRMRSRCEKFYPPLKNARVDPEYPLAQGLRPFRSTNVRVERDQRWRRTPGAKTQRAWNRQTNRFGRARSRIVHSYGQGGAGWTLSFGCAADVAALVQEVILDLQVQTLSDPAESLRVMSKL